MDQKASAKVLVLDFGAQYGQLIARRVRDLNVYSEIVPCDISADEIREMNASALILSGGPASVYAEDAPSIDPAIFDLGLPVLGFCYGHQITAVTLGGKVGHGHATMTIDSREHAIGARDIGRIHTADGSVATQQQRGHAKLGSNATRRVMDVKAARQAQKELGHTDAAGTRRQKVATLVQKHENGKHQQAPKDR